MIYSRFTQDIMLSTRLLNEVDDTARRKGMILSEKSIIQEARDIRLAMELINLGARLQNAGKRNTSSAVVASSGYYKNYAVARRA